MTAPDASAGDTATEAPAMLARLGAADSMTHACGVAATPDGHLYVVGQTSGGLWGQPVRGRRDMFLARLRPDGSTAWIQQIGDRGVGLGIFTSGCAVTAGPGGEAYVVGTANGRGPFEGQELPATYTGVAARFDPDGQRRWLRLVAEGPGATELMDVELHAGRVAALAWAQGDVVLSRFDPASGTPGPMLSLRGAREEVPMGLVVDGADLWIGQRELPAPLQPAESYRLQRLAGDVIDVTLTGTAAPDFQPAGFAVRDATSLVVIGETDLDKRTGDDPSFAFRVHHHDGTTGPTQAGARGPARRVLAFDCTARSCAVAGRVTDGPGSDPGGIVAVTGFLQSYDLAFAPLGDVGFGSAEEGAFTAVAGLAPAGAGRWYVTGWSNADLPARPALGDIDGFVVGPAR